jgi:hypothetical protein
VTESSIRHPTRLAGSGRWRPFADSRFEALFKTFRFPVPEEPAAWVRVKFTVSLKDPATEYAGDRQRTVHDNESRSPRRRPPASPQSDGRGGSRQRQHQFPRIRFRSPAGASGERRDEDHQLTPATAGGDLRALVVDGPGAEYTGRQYGLAVRRDDQRVGQGLTMPRRQGQVGRVGAATSGTAVSAG